MAPEHAALQLDLQFREPVRRKGLALVIEPLQGAYVMTDRPLLRRVVFNLVSNAVKYTAQGRVTVRAEEDTAGGVRLSVIDTGPGIAPERQSEVFEEYVRLDAKKAPEGLGIGLTIVRRATDLLGIPLALESDIGKGTAVRLTLPRTSARPAPAERASDDHADHPDALVALLENDEESRDATMDLLQHWGYRVVAAASANELAGQWPRADGLVPRLVITDLHLGGLDGLEQLDVLRALPGWADFRALLLTGDLGLEVAVRAREAGVALAHKPVMPRRLRALVDNACASAKAEHSREAGVESPASAGA